MIDHDNLEEYRDAEIYDAMNGGFEIGGRFYLDLALECGNPILELACGTGRLTIPLAEQGFNITGVDITPEMLARARQKAQERGVSVTWVQGDARSVRLERKFRMIFMSGNSFQAFLDRQSQEDLLRTVHRHLHPDGLFAFETRNPILSSLYSGNGVEEETGAFVDKRGNRVTVSERRWYEHEKQLEHYITCYRWRDGLGSVVTRETRISIRYVFPQELRTLLHYNGFELTHLFGDFDLTEFRADSPLMVCVCRKR
jgi:ubiquinone/menaquinone biosynthesis C-methylase UbiE